MISSTGSNHLLAALPQQERERVLNHCEPVNLALDEILGEPGERIGYVYFPADSFISLMTQVDGHDALGVGLIGSEGMLGASLVLGVHSSPLRARVQGPGTALRMKADDFQRVLTETPILERQLRLYLHVLISQLTQTAGCAAFHVVGVRLACWLLMTDDRANAHRFYLTHDRLARMLGVRRSGVTTAAGVLHGRKLINYTRGHISILDRLGLEQAACGCYRSMRDAFMPAGRIGNRNELQESKRPARRPRRDHLPGSVGRIQAPLVLHEDSVLPLGLGAASH